MLKFGYINFWSDNLDDHIRESYIRPLQESGFEIDDKLCNPTETECDVVITSVFRHPDNLYQVLGSPFFVCYSGENRLTPWMCRGGVSLSFRLDSENNLYFPIWAGCYNDIKYRRPIEELQNKTKFCTFIVSNGNAWWRNLVFEFINHNYKKIHSVGTSMNNVRVNNRKFVLPRDFESACEFHKPYKFNLCFENSGDETSDTNYITEKIVNAWIYGTVPVYWGSASVEEWLNPKAFINCKGKSVEEICKLVKFYDNNDEAYYEMLNQPLFKEGTDWSDWNRKRYVDFFTKKFNEFRNNR